MEQSNSAEGLTGSLESEKGGISGLVAALIKKNLGKAIIIEMRNDGGGNGIPSLYDCDEDADYMLRLAEDLTRKLGDHVDGTWTAVYDAYDKYGNYLGGRSSLHESPKRTTPTHTDCFEDG